MSDDMSVKEGVESAELSEKGLSLPPRALLNCTHSTCTDNLYRCSPPYQNEPHNSGHHACNNENVPLSLKHVLQCNFTQILATYSQETFL